MRALRSWSQETSGLQRNMTKHIFQIFLRVSKARKYLLMKVHLGV